jgi:hypothetical protein
MEPLRAIRCPNVRRKGLRFDTRCNGMIAIAGEYGYCPKCPSFFHIDDNGKGILRVKKMMEHPEIVFFPFVMDNVAHR